MLARSFWLFKPDTLERLGVRPKSSTTDVGAQSCGDVELAAQASPMQAADPVNEPRASAHAAPTPSADEFCQLQELVQAQAGMLSKLQQRLDASTQLDDSNSKQIAALQQEVNLLRLRTAVGEPPGKGATTMRTTMA